MARKKRRYPTREERNETSRAVLEKLPEHFPRPVLVRAFAQSWLPVSGRHAIDMYWRAHPARADRLARALAARSGAPEGWSWQIAKRGKGAGFRLPPLPWREPRHARGKGHCVVCGGAIYRWGWHADLVGDGKLNGRAQWHGCCVAAWRLWTAPHRQRVFLSRLQGRRCALSGVRLLKTAEVDHRLPLHRVWAQERDTPWPRLLAFWGIPNLQVIDKAAHLGKTLAEGQARRAVPLAVAAE